MTTSLLRFTHLGVGDRLRVARAALALRNLDLNDSSLDTQSFGNWLKKENSAMRMCWMRRWIASWTMHEATPSVHFRA